MNDLTRVKDPSSSAKMPKVTSMLLAAACAGLMATPAKAGSIYDESVLGDTSGTSTPTSLPAGTTQFIGTVSGGGADSFDNFIIQLPNTGAPTPLEIDFKFLNPVVSDIQFFGTFGGFLAIATPISPASGVLNVIVPAGQSLLVNAEAEGGTQAYTINLPNLDAVPLPNPAALSAAGLLGLGALNLLNKRAKLAPA